MKPLSKILLTLFTVLVVSAGGGYFYVKRLFQPAPNQLTVTGLPTTTGFVWEADNAARPAVAHAALLVPVRLPGCPRLCYWQFDTGAPTSLLYANPLAALRRRYPATAAYLPPRLDTLRNFRFALGTGQVLARRLRVLAYGRTELPADTTQPLIIGTLGADVLEGRVLILDYPRQQFTLAASVPDSLARRAAFAPLEFTGRRVVLTSAVQGQARQLLFDSGSSAFALLTSQSTWQQLAQPQAPVRHAAVNSLGKTLTTHTVATAAALQLGRATLPLGTVTYVEGTSLMQNTLMRFSGMGGMLGNAPFSQGILLLDVRGGRFGVLGPAAGWGQPGA